MFLYVWFYVESIINSVCNMAIRNSGIPLRFLILFQKLKQHLVLSGHFSAVDYALSLVDGL